ncbi:enoyl-CoA hydratase/carnithine racemase [Stella humosa]|uniref:Enoyl-CoA hydratase/carnithine racemase n=1 Tax=Stella humosa TaxID=94 RepID=A0A3N1KRV9_9PROT|nr:enoyl-CoA hydratase-related protein [Stella humosa]ROP81078.1 enoyl-CoA hydratase/carnithine racemase [Stella humosa]BBK29768.1 enoyl-CoA hydratase [Stella humosa]
MTIRIENLAAGGGVVARVTIDRPRRANALDSATLEALAAGFERLAADPALRVAVLMSAGNGAFSGGADVGEMAGLDADRAGPFIGRIHRVCQAIARLPVPVVARIQGACLGGAMEIAAACDLRVASTDARFAMPEVLIGIPSVVEAALLPRLVGWGAAADLVLTGAAIDGAEAHRLGFIQRLAPPDGLDDALARVVDAIAGAGPAAIRQQKRLMRAWQELPLAAAIDAGAAMFVESWQGDEPRRMMAAALKPRGAG